MRASRSPRPLFVLVVAAFLGAGIYAVLSGEGASDDAGATTSGGETRPWAPCGGGAEGCGPEGRGGPGAPPRLSASEACVDAGYLCTPLEEAGADGFRIARFPDRTRQLTVLVPPPEGEDAATARRLRRAAVRGIQTWQGHPFRLRFVDAGVRGSPDLEVRWRPALGGARLGRTRSSFRSGPGGAEYRVVDLTLSTRLPGAPSRLLDPRSVELAAAHEMGHALGLPHSDDPRDLMYPENRSTHPTARDYRTVEALYRVPLGALIRR